MYEGSLLCQAFSTDPNLETIRKLVKKRTYKTIPLSKGFIRRGTEPKHVFQCERVETDLQQMGQVASSPATEPYGRCEVPARVGAVGEMWF